MLRIALLICLATGTLAQVSFFGPCPTVPAVNDFDASRFAGKWYEIEKYFAWCELGTKCMTITYAPDDNSTITIHANGTGPLFDTGTPVTGLAIFNGNETEAKLSATFLVFSLLVDVPYWIIGTDYDNWAVIWSCEEHLLRNSQYTWLLTRDQNPSQETMRAAYAVLKRNRLSRRHLIRTDQRNC